MHSYIPLLNMRATFLFLCFFAVLLPQLRAQQISTVTSRWSDSFVAWDLFMYDPDTLATVEGEERAEIPAGDMQLRWLNLRDDWSEWDYQFGEERGTIKMKWKGDPTQWELRSYNGDIISMKAPWSNDLSEWKVTDNNVSLTFKSRYTTELDEWLVQGQTYGRFYMYTLRSMDPRDWAVEDELDENIPNSMRVALVFLAVFHGSPRQ